MSFLAMNQTVSTSRSSLGRLSDHVDYGDGVLSHQRKPQCPGHFAARMWAHFAMEIVFARHGCYVGHASSFVWQEITAGLNGYLYVRPA